MTRSAFKTPILSSYEESQQSLRGTWGASKRRHGVLGCSQLLSVPWSGCFCQLLNKQLGCLDLRFPGPTHPLYTTLIILRYYRKFSKPSQKPASCQLSCNASTRLLVQIRRGYNQASVNCNVLNISNFDFLKYKM